MGARGTDVAREAASLVLLDDDFNAIVAAVRMGRRIYDNLKKAMIYIVSVHIPIAGLSLIPVLLKWPLILFPVHIVLLELIIDPACTLVFEADEDDRDVMKRRPRGVGEKLLDRTALLRCAVQGSATLAVTLGIYWFIRKDHPAGTARALAFLTLVVCNIGMILSNRSLTRSLFAMLRVDNAALTWVITGTTAVLCLILAFPGMRQLFRFGPVSLYDVLTAFGGGIAAVAVMELLKWAIPACAECSRNPWDARRRRLGETESSSKARR
jgi:Ca2+-transporting ATPase